MNIIFDLDGTLIDSSTGILTAIEMAFDSCNISLKKPLDITLIGPPLNKLLPILAGTHDEKVLEALTDAFKANYDAKGYKKQLFLKASLRY